MMGRLREGSGANRAMRSRHVSIRTLTLVVALIAINCGYLRFTVLTGGGPHVFAWVGTLAIFNLLCVSAYRLFVDRSARRPFVIGFVVVGLAGLLLFQPILEMWHDPIRLFARQIGSDVPFIRDLMIQSQRGRALSSHQHVIAVVFAIGLLNVMISLPLFLVACLGGMLSSLVDRGLHRSPIVRGQSAADDSGGGSFSSPGDSR